MWLKILQWWSLALQQSKVRLKIKTVFHTPNTIYNVILITNKGRQLTKNGLHKSSRYLFWNIWSLRFKSILSFFVFELWSLLYNNFFSLHDCMSELSIIAIKILMTNAKKNNSLFWITLHTIPGCYKIILNTHQR